MSYTQIIKKIEELPHYREYKCNKCGHIQKIFILAIQTECQKCGTRSKMRRYSAIGSEIEDVLDAVLVWMGTGKEFDDVMNWKKLIDSVEE